jgi:SHS2 domain-containing protein
MTPPRATFEYVPHGGEVGLRVRGATVGEVLREAALGLSGLLLPAGAGDAPEASRDIHLTAPDRGTLLVDWLNELLFLADRTRWVPARLEIHGASDRHVDATARGPVLPQSPALVKAATWHGLRFEPTDGGYEAEVLLDV